MSATQQQIEMGRKYEFIPFSVAPREAKTHLNDFSLTLTFNSEADALKAQSSLEDFLDFSYDDIDSNPQWSEDYASDTKITQDGKSVKITFPEGFDSGLHAPAISRFIQLFHDCDLSMVSGVLGEWDEHEQNSITVTVDNIGTFIGDLSEKREFEQTVFLHDVHEKEKKVTILTSMDLEQFYQMMLRPSITHAEVKPLRP